MIFGLHVIGIVGLRVVVIVGLRAVVSCRLETSPCREVLPKFSILSLTHAISSLLCSLSRRVQTIPLACHRRLITSTLRRSPVLHRCPGGHTCSLRRRSRDVELCDVELVIINL